MMQLPFTPFLLGTLATLPLGPPGSPVSPSAPVATMGLAASAQTQEIAAEVVASSEAEGPTDSAGAVELLIKEYDQAVKLWRAELRAEEDVAAKRALRKQHPATDYFPRFAELLDGGQDSAAVWMISHVRLTDRSRKEADGLRKSLYARLFEGDLSDFKVLEAAAERLPADRKKLGKEFSVGLLTKAFDKASDPETKALMAYSLGRLYARLGGEENVKAGMAWSERACKEFADTAYGILAEDQLFQSRYLVVGATAPDFGGQSIDGTEIKLSDQRGKIVVVDFFGFW